MAEEEFHTSWSVLEERSHFLLMSVCEAEKENIQTLNSNVNTDDLTGKNWNQKLQQNERTHWNEPETEGQF